jgi:hypothetical protein
VGYDVVEAYVGSVEDVPFPTDRGDLAVLCESYIKVVPRKDVRQIMSEDLLISQGELFVNRLAEAIRSWRSSDGRYLPHEQQHQQCKQVQLELHKYLISRSVNNLFEVRKNVQKSGTGCYRLWLKIFFS